MKWLPLIALMLVALAACASDSDDFETALGILQPGKIPPDPRVQPLVDAGAPRLQVLFLDSGRSGAMVLETNRDGVRTWLSIDGASLLTEQGFVVGERGFGGGMMASDVAQSIDVAQAGHEADVVRFHTFLTGEDDTVTRSYKCRIVNRGDQVLTIGNRTLSTRLMRETCESLDQEFANLYWFDRASGRMIQSRQWLGDFLGVVLLREIKMPG